MPTPERGPAFTRLETNIRLALAGLLDQAGAISFLVSRPNGRIRTLEAIYFVPDVAGAGAGATQTLRVRKGGATGTIIASITITLANHVLGGPGVLGTIDVSDALARFIDSDTISITKDAGTVFTTASGTLCLVWRERPQARI